MKYFLSTLLFGLTLFNAQAFSVQLAPGICESELDTTLMKLKQNRSKGLLDYVMILGPKLLDRFNTIPPTAHWVEVGAGTARAPQEFPRYKQGSMLPPRDSKGNLITHAKWMDGLSFGLDFEINLNTPQITAIDFSMPDQAKTEIKSHEATMQGKFRYLEGRVFQSFRPGEIEPADLMTDFFPFHYTSDVAALLRTEFSFLKQPIQDSVGGELFLVLPWKKSGLWSKEHFPTLKSFELRDERGRNLSLERWLNRFRGVRYEFIQNGILFQRTDGQVLVPYIELMPEFTVIHESGVPTRRFLLRTNP